MQRAVMYPFTEKMIPIVRHWNSKKDVPQVTSVVMNGKRGVAGKDIGILHNDDFMGIIIHADLKTALADCDTLILMYSVEREEEGSLFFTELIRETLILGKNVICTREITKEEEEELEQLAYDRGVIFSYDSIMPGELDSIPSKLYIPEASIIMVGELSDQLDCADVVLTVNRIMQSKGYDSVAVLEQGCPALEDLYSWPAFLREYGKEESRKVYYLNNFIKYIDTTRYPDVIVVQIPDAMMKYNDELCNGFGIIPFMISQAVRADYFILCLQYGGVEESHIKEISSVMEKRFGFGVDCIHMSNAVLEIKDSKETKKMVYLRIPRDSVHAKLIGYGEEIHSIPIWDCLDKKVFRMLGDHIVNQLMSYATVESVL